MTPTSRCPADVGAGMFSVIGGSRGLFIHFASVLPFMFGVSPAELSAFTASGVWFMSWLSSINMTATAAGSMSGTASGIDPVTCVTWLSCTRACAVIAPRMPLGVKLPKNDDGDEWVIFTSTYFFVHGAPSVKSALGPAVVQ